MASRKQPKRTKERVWLSYDLGLRGNYDALYEWLDSKDARECGDSIATFKTDRTKEELKQELTGLLGDDKKVRVYLVTREAGGGFLLGHRRAAPWAGYFESAVENALDQ